MTGKVVGIVVAAGLSSRMSCFKPLLKVNGQTMIDRVIRSMRLAGAETILVVTGYNAALLNEHFENEDVVLVHNKKYAETKMFDSLCLALSKLPEDTEKIIMSPADVPAVRDQTIHELMKRHGSFIRPNYKGTAGHPIVFSKDMVPLIMNHNGFKGLQGLLENLSEEVVDIPVNDLGSIMDADTKLDFSAIEKYVCTRNNADI